MQCSTLLLYWDGHQLEKMNYSTKQILIKMFDPNRLSKSPAAFDAKKLQWVNNHYIKEMDLDKLTDMCLPYLIADGRVQENPDEKTIEWVKKIVSLYQPQMSYAAEIVDMSALFFNEHPVLNDAAKKYWLAKQFQPF